MRWTRDAVAARVDALAGRHRGRELVEAVARFAEELDDGERELLGTVLLERAREEGVFAHAWEERLAARGWLRRKLDALERGTARRR